MAAVAAGPVLGPSDVPALDQGASGPLKPRCVRLPVTKLGSIKFSTKVDVPRCVRGVAQGPGCAGTYLGAGMLLHLARELVGPT
jgi:hypothetical protein